MSGWRHCDEIKNGNSIGGSGRDAHRWGNFATDGAGNCVGAGAHRNIGGICAAGIAGVRAADLPGRWIRTPGYWSKGSGLLLGAGNVGAGAGAALWTPGYWAWGGNAYFFHEGYWGPQIYGGINYGYGYFGRGYEGGRWDRGHFYYNRSVNNVNVTEIHNVYNTTIVNRNETRVSYNGGRGGINERANGREEAAARERHMGAIAAQNQQVQEARTNRELRASQNHGKPPIAATQRPGAFSGGGVVPAREGGNYNPPPNRGGGNTGVHNNERTNAENNAARPNGGNNNANRPNNEHRANNDNRPDNNANRPPTYASQ